MPRSEEPFVSFDQSRPPETDFLQQLEPVSPTTLATLLNERTEAARNEVLNDPLAEVFDYRGSEAVRVPEEVWNTGRSADCLLNWNQHHEDNYDRLPKETRDFLDSLGEADVWIDAGCGQGLFQFSAKRDGLVNPACEAVGADFLNISAPRQQEYEGPMTLLDGFVQTDVYHVGKIASLRNKANLLTAVNLFHHIDDPLLALKSMSECLTPKGRLVVNALPRLVHGSEPMDDSDGAWLAEVPDRVKSKEFASDYGYRHYQRNYSLSPTPVRLDGSVLSPRELYQSIVDRARATLVHYSNSDGKTKAAKLFSGRMIIQVDNGLNLGHIFYGKMTRYQKEVVYIVASNEKEVSLLREHGYASVEDVWNSMLED